MSYIISDKIYVKLNDKRGVINIKGEEVVPCIYDDIYMHINGFYSVKLNNKWGINKNEKNIVPCKYDYIDKFKEGLAVVVLNNKYGFIDINNPTVFNEFNNHIDNIGSRSDTLYYTKYKDSYILKTGCFIGTLEKFEEAVEKTHKNSPYYERYMDAINKIKKELK